MKEGEVKTSPTLPQGKGKQVTSEGIQISRISEDVRETSKPSEAKKSQTTPESAKSYRRSATPESAKSCRRRKNEVEKELENYAQTRPGIRISTPGITRPEIASKDRSQDRRKRSQACQGTRGNARLHTPPNKRKRTVSARRKASRSSSSKRRLTSPSAENSDYLTAHKTLDDDTLSPRFRRSYGKSTSNGNTSNKCRYAEQSENLAVSLGRAVGIREGDGVLACGVGFGGEMRTWKEIFGARHVGYS